MSLGNSFCRLQYPHMPQPMAPLPRPDTAHRHCPVTVISMAGVGRSGSNRRLITAPARARGTCQSPSETLPPGNEERHVEIKHDRWAAGDQVPHAAWGTPGIGTGRVQLAHALCDTC